MWWNTVQQWKQTGAAHSSRVNVQCILSSGSRQAQKAHTAQFRLCDVLGKAKTLGWEWVGGCQDLEERERAADKGLWTNIREMGQLCVVLRCWPQDALSYPQNCTPQRANFTEHKVRHRSIDTMMVGKSWWENDGVQTIDTMMVGKSWGADGDKWICVTDKWHNYI